MFVCYWGRFVLPTLILNVCTRNPAANRFALVRHRCMRVGFHVLYAAVVYVNTSGHPRWWKALAIQSNRLTKRNNFHLSVFHLSCGNTAYLNASKCRPLDIIVLPLLVPIHRWYIFNWHCYCCLSVACCHILLILRQPHILDE